MIIRTQSWQNVTSFYCDITAKNPFFRPMMELAAQIAASKYRPPSTPPIAVPEHLQPFVVAGVELRRIVEQCGLANVQAVLGAMSTSICVCITP